jgi:hypothetical protein
MELMADMTEWFKYRTVDSTTRVQFPLFAFSHTDPKRFKRSRGDKKPLDLILMLNTGLEPVTLKGNRF